MSGRLAQSTIWAMIVIRANRFCVAVKIPHLGYATNERFNPVREQARLSRKETAGHS